MSQTNEFVIQDGVLLEYNGSGGTVVVPAGVRGIRTDTFQGNEVEEVILPEGLVWVGDALFSGLPFLRGLVLPGTLRIVPPDFCRDCPALEEVMIPEGVVFLSDGAFAVTALTHVAIPDSVRTIGEACFAACKELKEVSLGKGVQELRRQSFCECGNLRTISFPASLRRIGDETFRSCGQLRAVHMEEGLLSVGPCAFEDCPQLSEAVFPSTLESFPSDAFGKLPSLRRVTFPGNRVAFYSSSVCPATVIRAPGLPPEWIPAASRPAALAGYQELKEEGATLSPEIVGAWEAFAAGADPDSRKKPAEPFSIVNGVLRAAACTEGRVVVPEGVVGIRAEVFQRAAIREIWLPDSVQWIHEEAFMGCAYLEEVRLPAGLTRVPEGLFQDCPNLKSIHLPDGVKSLEKWAFSNTGLEELTLPASLEVTGTMAFYGCNRLRRVQFQEGLRELRMGAFSRCGSLTEVALPDSLALLEVDGFLGCTALERVSIGAGVRRLESSAFQECSALMEVTVSADLCSIEEDCFYDCNDRLRVRLEGSFADCGDIPPQIVAPNADPAVLSQNILFSLLRGFVSEDGRGFRREDRYLELLRAHKREVWDSEEVLRFLLAHDMLAREEIPDCLDALQAKKLPVLVAEVLEYSHRRFPEPAAPPFLE